MVTFFDGITLMLAILGALAGPKLIFQFIFPYLYHRIYNYNVRAGITYDGPSLQDEAQVYPWSELDPRKQGNMMVWVQNDGEHPIRFEVEFEINESWPLNRQVRWTDVFKESVPGKDLSLISQKFMLASGGGRNFTFPYVPHSESCKLIVTVVPTLEPTRLGLPRPIAEYLGEIRLRKIKRYYKISAEKEAIEEHTPYP